MLLGKIREKATGWLSYAIVVLITIPFALWGIHQYFGHGDDPIIAQIGDVEIPLSRFNASYQQRKRYLETSLGPGNLPPNNQIKSEVVSGLLQSMLSFLIADEYNYVVPDDIVATVVKNMPEFQKDGQFDREMYREILLANQNTENNFETGIRNDLRRRQFRNLILNSSFVLPDEREYFRNLILQERLLRYATLDAERFYDVESIGDQEAATYYEGNSEKFIDPEKVKIAYIEMSREKIAETYEDIDEEELLGYYEKYADKYFLPEIRRVAHILVDPDKHGESEANSRIDEVYERLESGEDFAELARTMSDDIATSDDGGELPEVTYGDWSDSPDLEDAVFDTPPGQYTDIVEDEFGIRVVKVLEVVQSSGAQTFEEVREQVVEDARVELAAEDFNGKIEELGRLIFEQPQSLEPAAEALNLEIVTLDWLTRSSPNELFDRYPAMRQYFYTAEVLQDRINTRMLEVETGRVFVLRADDYKPDRQLSFDESKEEVKDEMARIAANEQAADLIRREILPALEDGAELSELADKYDLGFDAPGYISRLNSEIEAPIIDRLFRMEVPDDKDSLQFAYLLMEPSDFVIIELSDVRDGETRIEPPALSIAYNEYEALLKVMMRETKAQIIHKNLRNVE